MFPDANDMPSACSQGDIDESITPNVRLYLHPPEVTVTLRPGSMLITTMPKAAIDIDNDLGRHERQVRSRAQAFDLPIDTVPQAEMVEHAAELAFARRVTPTCPTHSSCSLRVGHEPLSQGANVLSWCSSASTKSACCRNGLRTYRSRKPLVARSDSGCSS